ncbi:Transmembrane protein, partial [Globisporangium splendens]
MEYEVLWGDGPLGLTLRPDLGEDMPPVVGRITRLDSAAALAKVSVGHMLVSINGVDTARQGYDHVVGMLQKISRPATLRFRVPRALAPPGLSSMPSRDGSMPGLPMAPGFRHQRSDHRSSAVSSVSDPGHQRSSSREQYTVVWTEGPLGMILQPDKDDCHVPCIRKITGKGVGTGMERATVGDILVAVNGQETKSLGFRSTISLLKTIRKPAVLKFKRMRRTISRTPSYRDSADTASTRSIPTSFSNDPSVYDIVWREGDLGLKLKPGRHDVPVLSKLTGKGNASGLQFASIGDELVSVNGSPVEGEAYQDTLRMLKHSPKPAVLRFRRVRPRQSTDSIRSDPGFSRDLDSVRKPHVPVYAGSSSRSREPEPARRKKKKIPLDVAKELVSASLGMDGNSAVFAGMPVHMIEEGTEEAHLLRKEAKLCLTGGQRPPASVRPPASTDRSAADRSAKEALIRAEEEARALQEALEKVKNQAKKYEEILGTQKREMLLAPAIHNKSEEVVGRQNNMIAELSSVISGFRRESYTELEVMPVTLDDKDHQMLMSDLESVMNIPVVVPVTNYCADCGASDSESKLDKDEDGQYYCKDCWENFLNGGVPNTPPPVVEEEVALPPPPAPVQQPASPAPAPEPEAPPRSVTRLKSANKALEEQNARIEAEKKLMELKELRYSGSMPSTERQPSMTAMDRNKRDRRGMEEFARALREEEERARADGNLVLAKKLSAQIARIEADAGLSPTSGATERSPLSSMSDMSAAADSEFGHLYRNGHSSSSQGIVRTVSNGSTSSTGSAMKRGASVDGAMMMASLNADAPVPIQVLPPKPATVSAPSSPIPAPAANDYDDVNSDEEAEDHVDMSDQEDDSVLREVEEKNFALARQLDEAHSVVERARMSIMLSGDEDASDVVGLSEEQISLFKKLTSQADERMSTVDRLHPEDDSDSDSENSEDEEDDGVWI